MQRSIRICFVAARWAPPTRLLGLRQQQGLLAWGYDTPPPADDVTAPADVISSRRGQEEVRAGSPVI